MMSTNTQDTAEFRSDHAFAAEFFVPPSTPMQVEIGAASNLGLVRKTNEDHFAILRRTRTQEMLLTSLGQDAIAPSTEEAYCFVVADGIGGAAAGETASRVAIQTACELTDQASSWVMRMRSVAAQQIQERVEAFATEIHSTLRAMGEADPDLAGMGTTWTSVYVVGWHALVAQIGDSRGYLWRENELCQITRDQTLAQVLIDTGVPKEKTVGVRHILTNSLGGKDKLIVPDVSHLCLKDGDRLLLCTDGLSDGVTTQSIAELMGSELGPQAVCDGLVQRALDQGGNDNVTAVVAEFHKRAAATS
jgi:serine/threonine protein phosphatase PrpC